ncbi:hypothetical protein [Cetobacterium sp.]|uniref:hypothetical protein n=1 Tax=Cetobacterium sp. TaxID=2071632 RepID=UPI003F3D5E96
MLLNRLLLEQFRDVLEVPEAYILGRTNDKIIKPAKAELEKKMIYRFPSKTKGKGRRKIEKIEIHFSIFEAEPPKKKTGLTLEDEVAAREILQKQGVGFEILNEQKKKSSTVYIKTLKAVLKK